MESSTNRSSKPHCSTAQMSRALPCCKSSSGDRRAKSARATSFSPSGAFARAASRIRVHSTRQ
eukprot:4465248-Pyramimonas_sp.AAC.1